jgi:hypothetical protein
MSQWTFVLTETDRGRDDHGNHFGRRAIAIAQACRLGITIVRLPTEAGPDATGHYSFGWTVEAPPDGVNVRALCRYFDTQRFVKTTTDPTLVGGPTPPLTEKDEAAIEDMVSKLVENARAIGDV